jgi:hypothetical protein
MLPHMARDLRGVVTSGSGCFESHDRFLIFNYPILYLLYRLYFRTPLRWI